MNHWSNKFVGLPYSEFGRTATGVDCWGLVRLVYGQELDIELPSYTEAYTSVREHAELAEKIGTVAGEGTWLRVDQARCFDLAVFRRGHLDTHVGIVVSPGLMLHVSGGDHSKLEHYNFGQWAHRLTGLYRHFELTSMGAR